MLFLWCHEKLGKHNIALWVQIPTPASGFWPQHQFYPPIFLTVTFLGLPCQFAYFPNFRTNGLANFAPVSQTRQCGGPVFVICLLHCNSWPPLTVISPCQTRGFADFWICHQSLYWNQCEISIFFWWTVALFKGHFSIALASIAGLCLHLPSLDVPTIFILTRESRCRRGCCLTYLRASVCCLRVISGEGRTIHAECGAAVKCFIYRVLMR